MGRGREESHLPARLLRRCLAPPQGRSTRRVGCEPGHLAVVEQGKPPPTTRRAAHPTHGRRNESGTELRAGRAGWSCGPAAVVLLAFARGGHGALGERPPVR